MGFILLTIVCLCRLGAGCDPATSFILIALGLVGALLSSVGGERRVNCPATISEPNVLPFMGVWTAAKYILYSNASYDIIFKHLKQY